MRIRFKVGDTPWYVQQVIQTIVQVKITSIRVTNTKATKKVLCEFFLSGVQNEPVMVQLNQNDLFKTYQLAEKDMIKKIKETETTRRRMEKL